MSIYYKVYYNLCIRKSQSINEWFPGSGIHRHHILPRHSGGTDEISNFTYLTIREHIIAHFLLWKMFRNVNDLRSMKMLGANLSVEYRRKIGEWCRDNKIGFHGATPEQRREWSINTLEKQKQKPVVANSFYYWFTIEGRKERATRGGKASIISPNNPKWAYWASQAGQLERSSMGGKSHKGKRCMYRLNDKSFIRVKPEDIDTKLSEGYIFGSPIVTTNKKISHEPSKRRRKVSDGKEIYCSVTEAASVCDVTPGTIVYRCKSKKSTWFYV